MAFDRQYIVLGSSKDQVKPMGNAVTPPLQEGYSRLLNHLINERHGTKQKSNG